MTLASGRENDLVINSAEIKSDVGSTTALLLSDLLPGLDDLWAQTSGDAAVRIAVLDGPVDQTHPCFRGACIERLDTLATSGVGSGPASRHGTHVASIIFGQPGGPVSGVSPGCTGLIAQVFADGPDDTLHACSQLDLARAITQSVLAGAHIINVSAGKFAPGGLADDYLEKAVRLCAERNVLIVAAAGNDSCECLHVPAALPSVLAVGAKGLSGTPLESSNWGGAYCTQGILAPGEGILGGVPDGGTAYRSGTSYATAVVAGIAGLFLSIQRKTRGRVDPHEVKTLLLATVANRGTASDCRQTLAGSLDVAAALAATLRAAPHSSDAERTPEMCQQGEGRKIRLTRPNPVCISELSLWSRQSRDREREHSMTQEMPSTSQAASGVGPASPDESGPSGGPASPPSVSVSGEVAGSSVSPSDCGCGGAGKCTCKSSRPQLVYALGLIGHDFVSEARRDSLVQEGLANPYDLSELLKHLAANPPSAAAITWTLNQEATPIYAIVPASAFAALVYERIRQFADAQITEGIDQVSIPGVVAGNQRLLNGQVVPVIFPELRGMYSWSVPKLILAVAGPPPKDAKALSSHKERAQDIKNFLERVYYEIRNLGIAPQERAMNFAATNAFQIEHVYRSAIEAGTKLDSIQIDKSPICRPDSDCWDVKLTFFNPAKRFEQARHVYRFTVDVSDVIPVTVGKVRQWDVY